MSRSVNIAYRPILSPRSKSIGTRGPTRLQAIPMAVQLQHRLCRLLQVTQSPSPPTTEACQQLIIQGNFTRDVTKTHWSKQFKWSGAADWRSSARCRKAICRVLSPKPSSQRVFTVGIWCWYSSTQAVSADPSKLSIPSRPIGLLFWCGKWPGKWYHMGTSWW